MEKIFVATVQLTIEADSEEEAHDTINILFAGEMADEVLRNWNYLRLGAHRLSPTRNYNLETERARAKTWETAAG